MSLPIQDDRGVPIFRERIALGEPIRKRFGLRRGHGRIPTVPPGACSFAASWAPIASTLHPWESARYPLEVRASPHPRYTFAHPNHGVRLDRTRRGLRTHLETDYLADSLGRTKAKPGTLVANRRSACGWGRSRHGARAFHLSRSFRTRRRRRAPGRARTPCGNRGDNSVRSAADAADP